MELSECSDRADENPDELEVRFDTPDVVCFIRSGFFSLLAKSLNLSRTEFLFCWVGTAGPEYGEGGCGVRGPTTVGRPATDTRGLKTPYL